MLEFGAAAIENIPGVSECRFIRPGGDDTAWVEVAERDPNEYTVSLRTQSAHYGRAVLSLNSSAAFREFHAAVHNFCASLALRLENLDYQQHLEEHVRQQTEELQLSRAFFQSVFEESGDLLCVIDPHFTILQANPATYQAVLNHSGRGHELEGAKCYTALHGRSSPCSFCGSLEAICNGEVRGKTVSTPVDGVEQRWFDMSAFTITNNEGEVVRVVEAWRDITELKQLQDSLSQVAADREVLLREIHHRVKNNLNSVVSLLRLQFDDFESPEVQNAVTASIDRIQSTAIVHEYLYKSSSLSSIDFPEFVARVVRELRETHNHSDLVQVLIDVDKLPVHIDAAVPVSLIITELITNSLKYAFPDGRPGTVRVSGFMPDPTTVELVVEDDGVGLPDNFDISTSESLGMQLVQALVAQIDGTMELTGTRGTTGTRFSMRFSTKPDS